MGHIMRVSSPAPVTCGRELELCDRPDVATVLQTTAMGRALGSAGRWQWEGGSFHSNHVIAGVFSEGQANGQHLLEAEVVAERAEVSSRFVGHTDVCGTRYPFTRKTSATLPNSEPCSWRVQMISMEFASRQPRRQCHACRGLALNGGGLNKLRVTLHCVTALPR